MVDLESNAKTTIEAAATTAAAKTTIEMKFCRLCLEENDLIANLFGNELDGDDCEKVSLSSKLFDLLQIKYEQSALPGNICKECLSMVETFFNFRENVHKIESELQKRLVNLKYASGMGKVIEEPTRPGLNGTPGIFKPEEDAIIIEINPEQDYESSDDEFSMDSESETEESQNISKNASISATVSNLSSKDSLIAASRGTLSEDIEMGNANVTTIANQQPISLGIGENSIYIENGPSSLTYSCQFCDIAFSQQNECAQHIARHDPTGPYVCNFCSERFVNRQLLISHIKALHDHERPYYCVICNKGFVRRSDLRKHSIVHTGVRPFTCNVCNKGFSRRTNLTKHMRIHSGVKPNVCKLCPRSFKTAIELERHSRTHNQLKTNQNNRRSSSEQGKVYRNETKHFKSPMTISSVNTYQTNSMSDMQQRQHQIENMSNMPTINPYSENAGEHSLFNPKFVHADDPYRHSILATQLQQPRQSSQLPKNLQNTTPISTPSKQRSFWCDICSLSFTRERDYQRHQALHLDKLFTCKQCGMTFSRREKLVRHEHEQHAPQYPCNLCRVSFTKMSDYELHMKMHKLQQSVTTTAQAASMLGTGNNLGSLSNNQQIQQHQLQQQMQSAAAAVSMLPPPPPPPPQQSKEFLNQRPSAADMTFYSQMVPTMNLGFYSETRPEDRNGI